MGANGGLSGDLMDSRYKCGDGTTRRGGVGSAMRSRKRPAEKVETGKRRRETGKRKRESGNRKAKANPTRSSESQNLKSPSS